MIRGSLLAYVYIDHEQIKSEIPQQTASHINGAHPFIYGINHCDMQIQASSNDPQGLRGSKVNRLQWRNFV
jgi:hypothetical protein